MRTLMIVVSLALAGSSLAAQSAPDSLALGRLFTDWLVAGNADSLWAYMDDTTEMEGGKAGFVAQVERSRATLMQRAGFEEEVIEEKFVKRNGLTQYWRTGRYSGNDEPIMIRWVIVNGRLAGFGMNPARQAPPIDP